MSPSTKTATAFLLLLTAKAITALSTPNAHIAAISWGFPRVDIFGIAPDKSIWHKYDLGSPQGWRPDPGFENMLGTAFHHPSVISWGQNRLDCFHIGKENAAHHKYWDGTQWLPEGKYSERLEGNFSSGLSVTSWSPNRFDIVGRSPSNTYLHKAWTGASWYPSVTEWTDFGGNFSSAPASVSWAPNRLDIFGIDAESGGVKHKYWNGDVWVPQGEEWEDLSGGPFTGDLTVSSWGEGRFDIWAAGENGELNHLFWDGAAYQGWEGMGGKFSTAPAVVHWDTGKIDIVGLFDGKDGDSQYHSKAYGGGSWHPSATGWYDKGGDFAGQPALVVNKGTSKYNRSPHLRYTNPIPDLLYVLGVAKDGVLKLQIWDGHAWQPESNEYWDLGDTQDPYPSNASKAWAVQLDL
ncbi:hypothetical protein EG328_002488 [Venturia inaequalis]|uniref:PLL-like beta propeller domain-containing protein n=1 Tax=Venturia inaequalis TaxID=5025 RepID=A0A8H3Z8W6_VENIN|nr:hypothetical protein EG328_002488 [Venturia inaequalis]